VLPASGRGKPIDDVMEESNLDLDRGRAAFAHRAWQSAYDALAAASHSGDLQPLDLWKLALCSFLLGRPDSFADFARQASQAYADADDPATAARCAFWLGLHFAERADMAQATGWFGRASRLLQDQPAGPERGYLLLPAGQHCLFAGDLEAACRIAAEAAAIGEQYGDKDLFALALHLHGRALLRLGRIEDGFALLDEAMVGVTADELSPHVTGLIYCSVIGACREVWSLRRAQEWTEALSRWCADQPEIVAYTGECLVYRSEILRVRGAWHEAAGEARNASARFDRGSEPNAAGFAFYQLAEIHRLRGEFHAAMETYRSASRAGYQPQPGLALLRLAQNDTAAAIAALRRSLAETTHHLKRSRLLPAYIEVMLAVGETDEAGRAHAELAGIASACASDVLDAMVHQWRGAILLALGDPAAAVASLRQALEQWRSVAAPYDAARVHLLLSEACHTLGDADGATLERDSALAAFEKLGATWDLAQLDTRQSRGNAEKHGLTLRERQVLSLVATGQTNRSIGETLSISEKTVARHVANIFRKIRVSSRAAATAYAWEHGLANPHA
jgi:DNA-binding NarL/FixJ family response regulator